MALPKPPSLRCLRPFSTTLPTPKPTPHTHGPAPRYTKHPPPYPYGPAQHYKQSDSGLYGGATLQFGNKVSSQNAHKSRRSWRPNMHNKRLWSDGLGRFVQVKVQARVLRTVDKCGGLDAYLLGEKPGRVKELGVEGWRLRWMVMRTGKVRRRVRGEREALGLLSATTTTGQERRREGETLGGEVERASGEVVGRVGGARADSEALESAEGDELGYEEGFVDVPSSLKMTGLEDHINRTAQAIEAEIAVEALRPRSQGRNTDFASEESALMGEVARIEEVVEAEMEEAEGDARERLSVAMERLISASEELERVKAEGGAAEKKGMEGEKEAEAGILGKIKGLFGRR